MENIIAIQDGESVSEYADRLCLNKDAYGLKWDTIAVLVNSEAGTTYTGDKFRKQFARTRAAIEVSCDAVLSGGCDAAEANEELMKLWKIKTQAHDERNSVNALYRRLSREETLKEIAADYAEKMNAKKILPASTSLKPSVTGVEQTAILNVGDWHYGLEVNNFWNKFSIDICKKRIANMISYTLKYCKRHEINRLIVNGLGDYINGIIHLPLRIYSQEDVMSQVMDVCEILAEMIAEFDASNQFNRVEFYNVVGNHARISANKKRPSILNHLKDWFRGI